MKKPLAVLIASGIAMLAGCSSYGVKHATYDALYQKQCMDRAGTPDCDPEHKRFDEYQRERNELLKSDS